MNDRVSLDYLIVANHAEVMNGMLYLNGGGWSDLFRPIVSEPGVLYLNSFSVAISLSFPPELTNRQYHLVIRLEKLDDSQVLAQNHSAITVGKPVIPAENTIPHVLVAATFNVVFPSPGSYRIFAEIEEGGDSKEYTFRVHDVKIGT